MNMPLTLGPSWNKGPIKTSTDASSSSLKSPVISMHRPPWEENSQVGSQKEAHHNSLRRSYTSDEIGRKAELTVDEYIQNKDISETLKDIDEFQPVDVNQYAEFVETMITKVLERSEIVRNAVGQIFSHAIWANKLEAKWFVAGFKSILSMADDMLIDIPKIATYLSQIISPFVAKDSQLDFLSSVCEPIRNTPVCADFISELLHNASNRLVSIRPTLDHSTLLSSRT